MIYFAILAYLAALTLFLIFIKGASKLNNADDERLSDLGSDDARAPSSVPLSGSRPRPAVSQPELPAYSRVALDQI